MLRWIVVDGIDGSGKSTFAAWIKEHYQQRGEDVLVRIHPSPSWLGRRARRSLEGEGGLLRLVATLFFIMDVLDSVRRLRRDAKDHHTIVFVRYLMATAYLPEPLAPLGYDFFAKLLPVPKRLLLADVEPMVAHRRIQERRHAKEMFEDIPSLEKARRKIRMLARRGDWKIIDNNGPTLSAKETLLELLDEWDSTLSAETVLD